MRFAFILLMLLISFNVNSAGKFPPATEVFIPSLQQESKDSFSILFRIKPGYFIYKKKILLHNISQKALTVKSVRYPRHNDIYIRHNNKTPVYRRQLKLNIKIAATISGIHNLVLQYQGCSDQNYCYPPEKLTVQLKLNQKFEITAQPRLVRGT